MTIQLQADLAVDLISKAMSNLDYQSLLSAHGIQVTEIELQYMKAKALMSAYDKILKDIREEDGG